jgi:hypothetical protein
MHHAPRPIGLTFTQAQFRPALTQRTGTRRFPPRYRAPKEQKVCASRILSPLSRPPREQKAVAPGK